MPGCNCGRYHATPAALQQLRAHDIDRFWRNVRGCVTCAMDVAYRRTHNIPEPLRSGVDR